MSFTRTIENFTCEHCGATVAGDGYTNHCPQCLWSKHVDVEPGDRAADCHGLMRPVSAEPDRDGYSIYHRCARCGKIRSNRSAPSDDTNLLILLTASPLTPEIV